MTIPVIAVNKYCSAVYAEILYYMLKRILNSCDPRTALLLDSDSHCYMYSK
jgi:hypothetical protein